MRFLVKAHTAEHGQWISKSRCGLRRTHRTLAAILMAGAGIVTTSDYVKAQDQEGIGNTSQTGPQSKICDTSNQDEPNKLSLSKTAATPSDENMSVTAEKPLDSRTADDPKQKLRLRESDHFDAIGQAPNLLCKPPEMEIHSARPVDSREGGDGKRSGPPVKGANVSFLDGIMTVDPGAATLRDVVKAIQLQTGIKVEYPAGNMEDRVFGVIGPAPLRDVLSRLLYGSGLNYIIQTTANDQNDVRKLVLTTQTPTTSSQPLQASVQDPQNHKEPSALYGSVGFSEEGQVEAVRPEPVIPVSAPRNDVPGIPAGFNLQQAASDAHKTTSQILDEMQKHQLEILDAQAPPPPQ